MPVCGVQKSSGGGGVKFGSAVKLCGETFATPLSVRLSQRITMHRAPSIQFEAIQLANDSYCKPLPF